MSNLHEQLQKHADEVLKAVLELHKPVPCSWLGCKGNGGHMLCKECGSYPCRTIRTIAQALNVQADVRKDQP